MGIAPAPQSANIYCCVVEWTHVDRKRSLNWHTMRFIDDIFTTADEQLPNCNQLQSLRLLALGLRWRLVVA